MGSNNSEGGSCKKKRKGARRQRRRGKLFHLLVKVNIICCAAHTGSTDKDEETDSDFESR